MADPGDGSSSNAGAGTGDNIALAAAMRSLYATINRTQDYLESLDRDFLRVAEVYISDFSPVPAELAHARGCVASAIAALGLADLVLKLNLGMHPVVGEPGREGVATNDESVPVRPTDLGERRREREPGGGDGK